MSHSTRPPGTQPPPGPTSPAAPTTVADAGATGPWQGAAAPESAGSWYRARGKQKVGPYRWEELRSLAARDELRPDDMAWQEGTSKWRRAGSIPGLFPDLPPAPSPPGYEVVEELGRGGMGVVYKARQTALKRLVALKMILHADHAGPEERQRFRAEAEAVARLQHPNIVTVHETGEHGGAPFFSLEFCPGGSLSKKLAGAPQPPRAAAELVETLARAVHAAHTALIVFGVYWQTRPAYLDLQVKPADAEVTLDGEALPLTEGGARVSRSPGRHLRVKAEGYEDHEQAVVLVRGRANTEVKIELTSTRGYLRVNAIREAPGRKGGTVPEDAPVVVTRRGGAVVARGVTPYDCRLPAGDYVVRCEQALFHPAETTVAVPKGDQKAEVTLTLKPLDPDSVALLNLMKRLRGSWKGAVRPDDPKTLLRDVLEYVAVCVDLPLSVNVDAFKAEMVEDMLRLPVCDPPIRLQDVSVGTVVKAVLRRAPSQSGAVLIPRKGEGAGLSLDLTTGAAAEAERLPLLHPVRDLTTGDKPIDPTQLVRAVRRALPRGPEPADIDHLPGAEVLQVKAPWRMQEATDAYLTQLRKARMVRDPAVGAKAPGGPEGPAPRPEPPARPGGS
jgi:hypothetical protein